MSEVILVWGRGVDRAKSFDEAVKMAHWRMESDEDWCDKIEVIGGDNPRTIEGFDALWALTKHLREKDEEASRARRAVAPHVANVYVDRTVLESFYDPGGRERAQAVYNELRPLLGDRVTVKFVKNGRVA